MLEREPRDSDRKSLHDDDDDDDDFMTRIVHNSCQVVDMDGACYNTLQCQTNQLDLLTHCRQPFSFLSFCHHENAAVETALPVGVYALSETCEYCGSAHTRQCNTAHCHRPSLYFSAQKPPFVSDKEWNDKVTTTTTTPRAKQKEQRSSSSILESPRWVADFFRVQEA